MKCPSDTATNLSQWMLNTQAENCCNAVTPFKRKEKVIFGALKRTSHFVNMCPLVLDLDIYINNININKDEDKTISNNKIY